MRSVALSFLAGVLFAAGLLFAGMTDANRVLAFLNVAGDWDPSLALVMAAAIAVHATTRRLVLKRKSPLFSDVFHHPERFHIDRSLVVGAALFGLGWGLAGYCPGPALVSAATFAPITLLFLGAMAAGMFFVRVLGPKLRPTGVTP